MNDIVFEILDAAACLITGNAYMLILNIILSVLCMFPDSDRLTVFDLSGNSSKYSRFCPAYHDISDMLDILTDMQKQLDGGKNAPRWLIINNLDDIINNIYVPSDKKQFLRLLSDVLHRGGGSGLHVIVTAQKCTIPIISGIQCRVYAGKCDKKAAVKFFGADAAALLHSDMPDFGQALARIDSDIYKINVPDVSAAAAAFDTPIAADTAPQAASEPVQPETIPQQTTDSTAAPESIVCCLLQWILSALLGIISSISDIVTNNIIIKFAIFLSFVMLRMIAAPVKILCCLASSDFPGCFMLLCVVYMTVTTLLQCIR